VIVSDRTRVHVVVSGRVQGVFFRASAAEEARRLGLRGWIRNLPDGRVEAEAEGERAALERFVQFCGRGPPAAKVDDVEVTWGAFRGDLGPFATRRG
jgi:acylphosphatase